MTVHMAKRRLEVVITGDETSASKALKKTDQDLAKTEKGLANVGKSARKMGDDVDKGTSSVADKIKGLGTKLVAGGTMAGLAVGAALVKGMTDGMDVESVEKKLSAQMGTSPENAKKFGKVAGKLYGQAYGDSLSTVADALRGGSMNQLTDGTEAGIERITIKTLDLAEAFDQDLNQVTAAAGTLLKTGLAKDADEAFDVLTSGFQRGVDKQGDFVETLIEYPTLFRNLGLSARDATGILSQGLDAGARDADKVADALKEFSVRAVDGSKLTADGFKRIGLSSEDMAAKIAKGGPGAAKALDLTLDKLRAMKDPVDRSRAAVELFGTQAEDLGDALFALDPSEAVINLGKVEGAAERMGDTLNDTAKVRLESFKRQALQKLSAFSVGAFSEVSGLVSKVRPSVMEFWTTLTTGDGADTRIQEIAQKVRTFIFGIKDGFDSFVAGMRGEGGPGSFFTDLGEGVAAFGRVAMPIVQSVVGFIRDHFKPIMIGIGLLTAPLLMLAGGFIYLYQTSETFRDIVSGVFAVIKAVVTTIIDVIVGYFKYVLIPIFTEVVEAVKAAWGFIEPPLEAMRSFVAEKLAPSWAVMSDAASAAWGALPGIVNGALRVVGGLLSSFLKSSASIADVIGLDHIAKSLRAGASATAGWGKGPTPAASIGGMSVQGGIRRRHGGYIGGPDIKKDIIPAMLAPREYVMSPEATDRLGVPLLDALNQGRLAFLGGGLVPGWDDIKGMAHDAVGKARSIGARALDAAWPRMATNNGLASFPAGGANTLRDAAIKFIKGKETEMGTLTGGGFSRSGGGGPAGQYTAGMQRAKAGVLARWGPMAVGGYANRNIAGTNRKSAHGLWRAWDFMTGMGNVGKGNAIANWLIGNASTIGLKGLIWNDRKNFGAGWSPYGHPGGFRDATNRHLDHVHAEFFRRGGMAGAKVHRRAWDQGGTLEPGWNLLANRTGAREPLVPKGSDADIIRRLDRLIELMARQGPGVTIDKAYMQDETDIDRLASRIAFHAGAHTP